MWLRPFESSTSPGHNDLIFRAQRAVPSVQVDWTTGLNNPDPTRQHQAANEDLLPRIGMTRETTAVFAMTRLARDRRPRSADKGDERE